MAALFALLLFCASPAQAQEVAMRIGPHGNYTRVVFDFPKLTAYYVDEQQGDLVLTFDTPADIGVSRATSAQVLGITHTQPDANTEKVVIKLPPGATFKHYRLIRKIVVDIYSEGAPTAAAKKEDAPKTETAKTETPKPDMPAAPVTPAEAPLPLAEKPAVETAGKPPADMTAEELKKAVPDTQVIADNAAPAPAPAVDAAAPIAEAAAATAEPEATPAEPTKITISTVEPALMAAFARFGTLWVVMDTKAAGAITPDIKGPQAGFLGKPKILKFDGGIAYRYVMPPEHYVSVAKRSLTWEIELSKDKRQSPTTTQLNVVFDETAGRAKLMAEMKGAGKVLEIEDPVAGDRLLVVPANTQESRIDQARRFPDLEVIPAAIGLAVRPLKDGIRINRIENFVMITSPDGIIATPGATSGPVLVTDSGNKDQTRLFDFPNWSQGGINKLNENRRALEARIALAKTPEERSEVLMKLALLFFANNFGHETLGVLRMIEAEDEEMPKNPNFIAVRGAAEALAGQYQGALADLSNPALQQHPEVTMWIGFAAAATEQWHMANRSFPKDNFYLVEYPPAIAVPFTIYMAESALRLGNTDIATKLLHSLDSMTTGEEPHYEAAIAYLKGEAARQDGDFEEAIRHWTPVSKGLDRLYHAKASLALAKLMLQEKRITLKEAIDTIDSLRFAWRGDGLEVQILTNLGQLKVQNGQYLAGLQDMKTAALLSANLQNDTKPIEDDMSRVVSDLFAGDNAKDVSPLEAVAVYNEFEKYLPGGEAGMTAALNFADYLIRMDLLEKAAKLIEEQISSGVPDGRLADVGAKLAATYLLDDRPSEAIAALNKTASGPASASTALERSLLKARAQSQLNLTDDAIATLSPLSSDDARRLRADVLWRARKWAMAAQAIEAMLPPPSEKLDDDAARLVVNAAVAWKLAGDAGRLQAIKTRYQQAISATTLGPTFGVVTRDGGEASLADRDTILKIAGEVDMFKGFLDNYKSAGKGS